MQEVLLLRAPHLPTVLPFIWLLLCFLCHPSYLSAQILPGWGTKIQSTSILGGAFISTHPVGCVSMPIAFFFKTHPLSPTSHFLLKFFLSFQVLLRWLLSPRSGFPSFLRPEHETLSFLSQDRWADISMLAPWTTNIPKSHGPSLHSQQNQGFTEK